MINEKITPFQFYCQKVIPLIYDDSLSYYEVLCKIKNLLNQVISSQNNLIDQFNKMLEWVETQLKIYTKEQLEEWLKDGTLESLINKELMGKICIIYDGITEINTFLNSVPNGSTIKLPFGEYVFDYILLNNKKDLFIIQDKGCILKTKTLISPLSALPYYPTMNDYVSIVINDCNNIRWENLNLNGLYNGEDSYNPDLSKWSHGVIISGNSDRIILNNPNITNIAGEGILGTCNGNVFVNYAYFFSIRNSMIGTTENCKMFSNKNIGQKVGMYPNVSGLSVNSYWELTNCIMESVGPGVKLGHEGKQAKGIIEGNIFTYKNIQGTPATKENCFSPEVVQDLTIKNNIINNYYYGINASIWNTGDGLILDNNIFNNVVMIPISSFSNKNNVEIINNSLNGGTHGIRIVNNNKGIKIKGNKINNISNNAIWFNGSGNIKCIIDENIINTALNGINIQAKNPLNIIGENNIFNSVTNEVIVDIDNANYQDTGLINNYLYNPYPVLETNGNIDGVTKHSPSMNRGHIYTTPTAQVGQEYIIFRLDNGYDGQIVNILFTDGNTKVLVKNVNNNSGNIITASGTDYQPPANSIMTLKCFLINNVLTWKVISLT